MAALRPLCHEAAERQNSPSLFLPVAGETEKMEKKRPVRRSGFRPQKSHILQKRIHKSFKIR